LVPDRGGAEFKTGGNLLVVEDLKRGTNKDMGPKDIFEIGSICNASQKRSLNMIIPLFVEETIIASLYFLSER